MALNPCCCMSPKTGATIIGIIDIIICAISIICLLFSYSVVSSAESNPALKEQLIQEIKNQMKVYPTFQDLEMDDETLFGAFYALVIFMLVVCIIGLFLASILIHGIRTENTQLLKFHLIIYATLFCISLVGAIGYLAMGEFLSTFIIYGLSFYFLMVIYYAYLEVRDKVSQRQTSLVKYEVA